jgi:hypothetical protein
MISKKQNIKLPKTIEAGKVMRKIMGGENVGWKKIIKKAKKKRNNC